MALAAGLDGGWRDLVAPQRHVLAGHRPYTAPAHLDGTRSSDEAQLMRLGGYGGNCLKHSGLDAPASEIPRQFSGTVSTWLITTHSAAINVSMIRPWTVASMPRIEHLTPKQHIRVKTEPGPARGAPDPK